MEVTMSAALKTTGLRDNGLPALRADPTSGGGVLQPPSHQCPSEIQKKKKKKTTQTGAIEAVTHSPPYEPAECVI